MDRLFSGWPLIAFMLRALELGEGRVAQGTGTADPLRPVIAMWEGRRDP